VKLLALLVAAALGALLVGPAGLADAALVWELRAPRVLAAIAAGAALGLSGVAMQTVLRNPLADPYILGMSGGASLGAVLAAVGAIPAPPALAGAVGAWIAAMLVGALSGGALRGGGAPLPQEEGTNDRLLLVGVAVSMLAGAFTTVALQLAPEAAGVRAALYWLAGGLGGATLPSAAVTLGAVVLLGALAAGWTRDLDALLLGEDTAATLGVSVTVLRQAAVVSAAVLTGLVVALGGAIGFCGLLAPHLARRVYGATHRRLLPGAMGLGALLLLVADTAARTVAAPRELPVGALTALVGAPWMLVLLGRRATC
jgi:iron complex transport system permease protein